MRSLLAALLFAVAAVAATAATIAAAASTAAAVAAPLEEEEAQTAVAVQDYEIGPEDILKVTVYGHEDLTQTVLVQADGTFTYPLVGRVKAEGLTPKQLEQKLAVLLARDYVRNPQITVVVQEFRSKTVFVVGEVQKPGTYPVTGKGMSLVEVLAKAGPVTANAGPEVIVVRPAAGADVTGPVLPNQVEGAEAAAKAEVFRINVRDIQAGELEKNIELRPRDTVFVPQAPKVFVTGEVRTPGAYPWFPGLTARQLISLAGGLLPEGSSSRLKVVRQAGGASREDGIKLDELVKAGETLVVRRRLF